jgi:flagellar hook-associated protein 1
MSLTSALNTAQSILSNTSTQTSIVSRNISNAGAENYVRRSATLASNGWGAQVVNISRAANDVLFRDSLVSTASASGQNALLDGIDQIRALIGGNDFENAPAALMGSLRDSLQLFASQPSNTSAAQAAVSDAILVADGIRQSSIDLQKMRLQTDTEISRQVEDLNKLLGEFEVVNNDVRNATRSGQDASDALDTRDGLLKRISEIIGVTVVQRPNNDIALYTKEGATLFETVPRNVTFARTNGFDANTVGNAVLVDGVPIGAGQGGATTASGSLGALLQVRDTIAPTYQAQLDEMARALVTTFREVSQTGGTDLPGLFTWSGGTVPADGTIVPGMATSLSVNAAYVQPNGNAFLLRDGGVNGADYVVNVAGAAGFSSLIEGLVTKMSEPVNFDVNAQIGASASLFDFAASSVGWMESLRQQANTAAENKNASYYRTTQALSNATGVNIDEEMAKLLELEQSYKASARIITAVDEMIDTLLRVSG